MDFCLHSHSKPKFYGMFNIYDIEISVEFSSGIPIAFSKVRADWALVFLKRCKYIAVRPCSMFHEQF